MGIRLHLVRTALAAGALALSPTLAALSPPPPLPVDVLEDFYEAMNGDDWHRNDGWLDPEVDVCDWYGISCMTESLQTGGFEWVGRIRLPDNNLRGELDAELQERMWGPGPASVPSVELDLSGNAIEGELTRFPWSTEKIDLSGNALTGALPVFPEEPSAEDIKRILLARNDLEGSVPASWEALRLRRLELSDNRLDAGAEHAFAAMHGFSQSFLYLDGNDFTAELGAGIMDAGGLAERGDTNVGAGLDLCFNDFLVEDPQVRDWIAARHVGSSDFETCLGRQRVAVDATVSGSWFHPDRAGEGVSLMLLDSGAPLLYGFGFDTEGRQQWLFELGAMGDQWLRWDPLRETRGHFGEGVATDEDYRFVRSTGRFRADRVGVDTLSLHRHYYDLLACGAWGPQEQPGPGLCPPPLIDDRLDYQRLSQLAGASCDNQSDLQEYSGAWYNPERSGEGFLLEVLSDDRAVVYWFTYSPDDTGTQAWIVGDGGPAGGYTGLPPIDAPVAALEFDSMVQPLGTAYGPDFDSNEIDFVDWGSLRLEFFEDGSGHVEWDSHRLGYESGNYPVERLARPMLAECEGGDNQNR